METLTFLGDVFLPQAFTSEVADLGMFVPNLEYPITTSEAGHPGKITLKADKNYLSATFGALPAAVCLANNHVLDYGAAGLQSTLELLDAAGIKYFGAGYRKTNCNNPALIQVGSLTVALLGYVCPSTSPVFADATTPGVVGVESNLIARDIQLARREGAARVVVSLHWGAEEVPLPKPVDVELARKIVDSGADLVIGHHAHCIQPWERYRSKHIFYGLGNCILPNLDVPANFNEARSPKGIRSKVQRYWNKKSLAVGYTPEDGSIAVRELHFDGKTLRTRSWRPDTPARFLDTNEAYQRRFHRVFVLANIRAVLGNYFASPRLPGRRHVRGLKQIMKSKDYK